MIISSTLTRARVRAFTLLELLVATSIASFILVGVITCFLMLVRSGANIANYSTMESQSRRGLEEFGQDLRMASNVTWNTSSSITLTVPDNYVSTSNLVTYAYDSAAKSFYRKSGAALSTATKYILIKNVAADFTYTRFDRLDNTISSTVPADAASALALNYSTKRIQLSMSVRTSTSTAPAASNNIMSASFILRNKPAN